MEVKWQITNKKCRGDRKFYFKSNDYEAVTLFKVCEMVNLLANNEWKIKKQGNWNRYLFQEAILKSIEMGKNGINWDDPKNRSLIKKLCAEVYMPFEVGTLSNIEQLKLGDFK